MKYQNGEDFLNYLNKNMHLKDVIMHIADKRDTPVEKISKYMSRLERIHNIAKNNKHKMDILKQLYYDKYVIDELPESYIALQQKISKEKGCGDISLTEEIKTEMLMSIQKNQKHSLDSWLEYFCSNDAIYPMWFKNYAFTGMLRLGKFDKEKNEFTKRTKITVEPYVDLNMEALAQVYNTLSHQIGKNELTKVEELALTKGESFKKLYSYYLQNIYNSEKNSEETDGVWIKYNQGDDYRSLWKSLQGKNTGWCTAGEEAARSQLKIGDFYIYYTRDKNNEYKNSRIAIRMNENEEIEEIRGIAKDQNLESNMEKVLEEKLSEFADKDKYQKKVTDMNMLTILEKKQKENIEFTKEELRFLYEIDNKIKGFGWEEDPRIAEIKLLRNSKKDIAIIYELSEELIATKVNDISKTTSIFYGDLELYSKEIPSQFSNLQVVIGSVEFPLLTDASNLNLLQAIIGNANFGNLKNSKDLKSLRYIGGGAVFSNLSSSKGLDSLQFIGKTASFESLTDASHLTSLKTIGRSAIFKSLKDSKGLESLQYIGKLAYFYSLESALGLKSLTRIDGPAYFLKLVTTIGLENLHYIGGSAYFANATDSKGLGALQEIVGNLEFDNLRTIEGLDSLQKIGGEIKAPYVDLNQLIDKNNSHHYK